MRYPNDAMAQLAKMSTEEYEDFYFNTCLLDYEKIWGSFHFTLGNCYDNAYNGNKSSLHLDLICIQKPEYGGGEIYFDDVLIRKDGYFVLDELLNV